MAISTSTPITAPSPVSGQRQADAPSSAGEIVATTFRLDLRRLRDSDAALIQPLADNWDIARQTINLPHPYSLDDARRLIAAAALAASRGKEQVFAISRSSDGTLVGLAGLITDMSPPEAGYWIGAPYWGQGFASEALGAVCNYALRALDCARIDAVAFSDNLASIRVLEKCGFRHLRDVEEDIPARGGIRTVRHYRWAPG